ncbi:hypothetical protein KBX08_33485, partial [Micromonospora sp. H61]|uniref:hypothetical protein n=1 Tax=Micromonospora sp. H61 TaxID=2824888 RepID=UPI001B35D088|nr:hypothetical protein [Micromonospora sp. H61]
ERRVGCKLNTALLSQGPAVLAAQARDQPAQVRTRTQSRFGPPEPRPDPGMQPVQLSMPPVNINIRHRQTNEREPKSIRLLPLQY